MTLSQVALSQVTIYRKNQSKYVKVRPLSTGDVSVWYTTSLRNTSGPVKNHHTDGDSDNFK